MKKTILKFGFLTSGVLLLLFFATFFLMMNEPEPDYKLSEIVGFSSMFLASLTVVFAMLSFRKEHGGMTLVQGLQLGLGISAMSALAFVLFDTAYITIINPDFMGEYLARNIQDMQANGASEKEIADFEAEMAMYQGPVGVLINAVTMFLTVLVIGMITSLIASLVVSNLDKFRKRHALES